MAVICAARRCGHVLVATGVALAMSSCSDGGGSGGLMLVIRTDLTIPKDIDTVRIQILRDGVEEFRSDYPLGSGTNRNPLPATLAVVPGRKDSPITIRGIGIHAGTAATLREAVIVVPRNSVEPFALDLPAEWLCIGQVQQTPAGEIVSTCPKGQTCKAGTCVSNEVSASDLPRYSPQTVFGGGTGPADGACFDTLACFSASVPVTLDAACTVQETLDASTLNLAALLAPAEPGFCTNERCLVPLVADSNDGWMVDQGKIRLPAAICSRIAEGAITGVVATELCEPRTIDLPPCGQASTAGVADPTDPTQSGDHSVAVSDSAAATVGVGAAVSDATGSTTALWIQHSSPNDRVMARQLVPHQGLGEPQVVADVPSGEKVMGIPSLVASTGGVLVAAWIESQQDVQLQTVKANRFTPGVGWGTPVLVSDAADSGMIQDEPHVSADSLGNVLVAWTQGESPTQVRWLSPDGNWGNPFSLPELGAFDAMAVEGSALVARTPPRTPDGVWLDRYRLDGTPDGSDLVSNTTHVGAYQPRVVPFGNKLLVAWTEDDNTSEWLRWSTGILGDGWSAPDEEPIQKVSVVNTAVASDALGNVILAWLAPSAGGARILARRLGAGVPTEAPTVLTDGLSIDKLTDFMLGNLAFDFSGNGALTWAQVNASGGHEVWLAEYKANQGWLPAIRASDSGKEASYPTVTFDTRGSLIAGWSQTDAYWLARPGQKH